MEHSLSDAREALAQNFGLTETDRVEAPSFSNRVAWRRAISSRPDSCCHRGAAIFQITDRGRQVLVSSPGRVDIRLLEQFPEFLEFRSRADSEEVKRSTSVTPPESDTPEEALSARLSPDESDSRIRASLPSLRTVLLSFSSSSFVELFAPHGLRGFRKDAGRAIGHSGDEGIDGIGTVGRPEIQKFVGALHGKRARKGVFITTGSFSGEASDYVDHIDPKVVLIDGRRLAELMIDFRRGCQHFIDRSGQEDRLELFRDA